MILPYFTSKLFYKLLLFYHSYAFIKRSKYAIIYKLRRIFNKKNYH